MATVFETNIEGLKLRSRGKVRDIYDLGDELLIVSTDRISAFDSVLPTPIPDKGRVLNGLSEFWFRFTGNIVPNHMKTTDVDAMCEAARKARDELAGRCMLVTKARPLPVECVVRGYLAGGAWKDYQACGAVCGIKLPRGLKQGSRLEEPIFSPATKSTSGHDENIDFGRMCGMVGEETAAKVRDLSIRIYKAAAEYALSRGIIIADTKFEFGIRDGELILIDEVFTPDSSRFWPSDGYTPGGVQLSFDKQFVRDYLEAIGWNKEPPAPPLPEKVVEKTREKYLEAYKRLTGRDLDG
ncbi:MAG: phosphoribosylaminoimidazolesuccinocarboxamide synthase [Planctomycetota bacterium]|nr:phosphoribosylaminoimidazolesuccinocarboxamide synthase [Planctomycetota bacterium]